MSFRVYMRRRIWVSRIAAVMLIGIFLFSRTEIESDTVRQVMDSAGLLFIAVGAMGRIWSSLFICGHKNVEIIDQGPYSVVRNPLYLFSFIGVAGIALSTWNWIFIALILLLFFAYYPFVIIREEKKLIRIHGERFASYARQTPRIFPDFNKFSFPATCEVDVRRFSRAFLDAIWFFAAYVFIEWVKFAQANGFIPFVRSF